MTDTDAPTIELPEILSNEDGDVLLAQGHVDPALFMLSVVLHVREHWAEHDVDRTLLGGRICYHSATGDVYTHADQRRHLAGLIGDVRHETVRPSPDNDELMIACEPDAPDAEAWTYLDLPW